MAAYEYLCRTCGASTVIRASFAEKSAGLTPTCATCKGEEMRRVFTPVSVSAGGRASSPGSLPMAGGGSGGGCCGGGCGCG